MSNLYYESSLAHYGVRGQKWGVRRYQTSDGRWTHLGRKRNQVKDLKRSERDKTDRTKARLEAQKKKLAYEKSLGPSDHPNRDAIKAKAKEKTKESLKNSSNKVKATVSQYNKVISDSKKKKLSKEDQEVANFMKSLASTSLIAISKSNNSSSVTKADLKEAWRTEISDIRDDIVYDINNFKIK